MYGSYTHDYEAMTLIDLLILDSCLLYSGVIGKLDGDLYPRWKADNTTFINSIFNAMHSS